MCAMQRVEPLRNTDTLPACRRVPTEWRDIKHKSSKRLTLLDDVNGVFVAPNKRAFCTTAVRDTSAKRFIAILSVVTCLLLVIIVVATAKNYVNVLCAGK